MGFGILLHRGEKMCVDWSEASDIYGTQCATVQWMAV
jgi:hypothetical protein